MMIYTTDPMDPSPCHQPPLYRLMHSNGCSLVLSMSLLGVGVTITAMSLQSFSSTNKIFLIGPILMTVGILGLSRFLMQYLKKMDNNRRRRENQIRSRHERQRWPVSVQNELNQNEVYVAEPHRIPQCCSVIQREDSESAMYLGPTDSEDGYSDDPPPYDAVTVNTGSLVTSRVQLENSISSSLPSLPPYDEGLVNPALDLSTETFPAPPPYEVVAVQPPSYSAGSEGLERPVRAMHQHIRSGRKKIRDPTRRTVREVAERLAQTMQMQEALAAVRVAENEPVHDDSLADNIGAHLEALERQCLQETITVSDEATESNHEHDMCSVDCGHQLSLEVDRSQPLQESLSILIHHHSEQSAPDSQQIYDTNIHIDMEAEPECCYLQSDGNIEEHISLRDVDNSNTVPCVSDVDKDQSIETATTDSLN